MGEIKPQIPLFRECNKANVKRKIVFFFFFSPLGNLIKTSVLSAFSGVSGDGTLKNIYIKAWVCMQMDFISVWVCGSPCWQCFIDYQFPYLFYFSLNAVYGAAEAEVINRQAREREGEGKH